MSAGTIVSIGIAVLVVITVMKTAGARELVATNESTSQGDD